MNFIKIDVKSAVVLTESNRKDKIIFLIIIEYIIPFISEIISKILYNKTKQSKANDYSKFKEILKLIHHFKSAISVVNLIYNLTFIFKSDFLYNNFRDHLLKIMIVNQGSKESFSDKFLNIGKQLNLFFLYMVIRFSEWFLQRNKQKSDETITEVEPPRNVNKQNIKNECPICHSKTNLIKNQIVLSCCGFIYCEECLKNKHKCKICETNIETIITIKIFP